MRFDSDRKKDKASVIMADDPRKKFVADQRQPSGSRRTEGRGVGAYSNAPLMSFSASMIFCGDMSATSSGAGRRSSGTA